MADQPTELRQINWGECFPFTLLFRTFKMAIHPTKLMLALVGVLLTGICGTILDGIWSNADRPLPGEVNAYWRVSDIDAWQETVGAVQTRHVMEVASGLNLDIKQEKWAERLKEDRVEAVDDLLERVEKAHDRAIDDMEDEDDEALAQLGAKYNAAYQRLKDLKPPGVFRSFVRYERKVVRQLIDAAGQLNFVGGIDGAFGRSGAGGGESTPQVQLEDMGVLSGIVLAIRGMGWMATQHSWYTLVFGVISLAIWAVIGGAICRVAALNVAFDERLSFKRALMFARRKFLSFVAAPLLPLGLIVGIGVVLILGGVVTAIPYVGDIIGAVGVLPALAGGFLIAMVVIGALAGGSLLWPAIAVEGSDGFDALSRSYSYVFSKPWRAAFYAVVVTVYGAVCYLFARFFVFILLVSSRAFVGLGVAGTDRPGLGDVNATKLDAIWPAPTFEMLKPAGQQFGLEGWDSLSAFFVCLFVLILVCALCAFLVSFFYSGATVIYYLLRRQVDGTDIEDVFLDEEDREEELASVGEAAEPGGEEGESSPGESPAPEAG
jgi:hypothetical protein